MATKNKRDRNSAKSATPNTTSKLDSSGTSAEAQRARLLSALKRGPVNTIFAYRQLDILHVPRRVLELRELGYPIITAWIWRYTEQGVKHRVGEYRLEAA